MNKRIVLRPIGWVYNDVNGGRYSDWEDVISEIVLDEDLAPALEGIEGFSHITVLFYLSGLTRRQRAIRRLHPRDQADAPEVGVFATHTQFRPNSIAITTVKLLERKDNRLRVSGLDAFNGTPVLDIKSFTPDLDLAAEARIPEWMQRLVDSR